MKRKVVIAIITIFASMVLFSAGWVSACVFVNRRTAERLSYSEEQQRAEISRIRQGIFGANRLHLGSQSPEIRERLDQFDSALSKGSISFSYVGGYGGKDTRLQLRGDGTVHVRIEAEERQVAVLDHDRCKEFFRRTLASGILNCSEGVISMKEQLERPVASTHVTDRPTTTIDISVPEMEIDYHFSIYSPETELRNYPDIVEFRLIVELEKDIQALVPKDDPVWR